MPSAHGSLQTAAGRAVNLEKTADGRLGMVAWLSQNAAVVILAAALFVAYRIWRERVRVGATLEAVVGALQEGLIVRDNAGEIVLANPAADELLGQQDRGAPGYEAVTSAGYVRADGTRAVGDELPSARARRTGEPVIGEVGAIEVPGVGERWLRVTAVPVRSGGRSVGTATTLTDITAERAAAMALRAAEHRFRVAFENAPIGMVTVGANGVVTAVNAAFCSLLDRTEDDLVGLAHEDLLHPDEIDADTRDLEALVRGDLDACTIETRYLREDATVVFATVHVNAFRSPDPRETVYLAQVVDLTAQRALREQLAHAAMHDALTGVANRRLLEERLTLALTAGEIQGHAVGLLFCDLDDFKAINDRYGHAVGDHVLATVADRLISGSHGDHTVARIGGDEFVVLAPMIGGTDEVRGFEARVRREVERTIDVDGIQIAPRVSIGVFVAPPGSSVGTALRMADAEMYRAKATRRQITAT